MILENIRPNSMHGLKLVHAADCSDRDEAGITRSRVATLKGIWRL